MPRLTRADIDQIQAREVARNNNCTPSKIDIYQQSLGSEGTTVYRIDCSVPKTSDANAPKGATALLVSCKDNLCELLRAAGERGDIKSKPAFAATSAVSSSSVVRGIDLSFP